MAQQPIGGYGPMEKNNIRWYDTANYNKSYSSMFWWFYEIGKCSLDKTTFKNKHKKNFTESLSAFDGSQKDPPGQKKKNDNYKLLPK